MDRIEIGLEIAKVGAAQYTHAMDERPQGVGDVLRVEVLRDPPCGERVSHGF